MKLALTRGVSGALVDWESCADRKNIQMVNDEEWKRLSNVPIYNVMSWPFFWLAVGVSGTIKCTGTVGLSAAATKKQLVDLAAGYQAVDC
jgi:hypothetical protein